jgi:hypothetical protein
MSDSSDSLHVHARDRPLDLRARPSRFVGDSVCGFCGDPASVVDRGRDAGGIGVVCRPPRGLLGVSRHDVSRYRRACPRWRAVCGGRTSIGETIGYRSRAIDARFGGSGSIDHLGNRRVFCRADRHHRQLKVIEISPSARAESQHRPQENAPSLQEGVNSHFAPLNWRSRRTNIANGRRRSSATRLIKVHWAGTICRRCLPALPYGIGADPFGSNPRTRSRREFGLWGERARQYSSARMMVSTRVAFPVSIASLEAAMSRAKQSTSKM